MTNCEEEGDGSTASHGVCVCGEGIKLHLMKFPLLGIFIRASVASGHLECTVLRKPRLAPSLAQTLFGLHWPLGWFSASLTLRVVQRSGHCL